MVFRRMESGCQRYYLTGYYYHIVGCSVIMRSCFLPSLYSLYFYITYHTDYNSLIYLGFIHASSHAFLLPQFRPLCFVLCQIDPVDSPEMCCGLSDLHAFALTDCLAWKVLLLALYTLTRGDPTVLK